MVTTNTIMFYFKDLSTLQFHCMVASKANPTPEGLQIYAWHTSHFHSVFIARDGNTLHRLFLFYFFSIIIMVPCKEGIIISFTEVKVMVNQKICTRLKIAI